MGEREHEFWQLVMEASLSLTLFLYTMRVVPNSSPSRLSREGCERNLALDRGSVQSYSAF